MADLEMRIGIDLGGTKIEALAISGDGVELVRHRIDTPRDDYFGTIQAMAGLVKAGGRGDRSEGGRWGQEFRGRSRGRQGW